MKLFTTCLVLVAIPALAPPVSAQRVSQGLLELGESQRLEAGAELRLPFELPEDLVAGLLVIDVFGVDDTPEGARIRIVLDGEEVNEAAARSATPLRRELPGLSRHLRPGSNELVVANPNDAGTLGIAGVKVSFAHSLPDGAGRTNDWLEPLPWDGSGDPEEREPRARENVPDDVEVGLTLLSPLAGQSFAVGDTVFIEWEARGFPPGSGVSLHCSEADGPWTPIQGAERLAYDEPGLHGVRGRFAWTPDRPLADLRIGLGYVAEARRSPRQHVVGGEDGLATIAEALALCGDGDTIALRPGTYREEVVLYHDVELIGEDRERCVILSPASRGVVVAEGVTARVAGLTIDGGIRVEEDLDDAWGLHVAGGKVTVRAVTIRNVSYGIVANWDAEATVSGLLVDGATRGIVSTRGAVTRVKESEVRLSEDPEGYGAAVWIGGVLDLVDVALIGRGHGTGLAAEGPESRIVARDCTVTSTTSGVEVADRAEVELHGVACVGSQELDNPMTGLHVTGGARAKAVVSTFRGFRNPGVTAQGAGTRVEIVQCEIDQSSYHGILISGEAHAVLRHNRVHDNKHTGIQVMRGATAEITGNTIERNTWGIYLTEEPGQVEIRSNFANENKAWGYHAPGVDLSGNKGSGNGKGLIREARHD